MLRCQGVERLFVQVVTDTQLGAQIGNAMGQNVLERIFCKLLPAAGLVGPDCPLVDRWVAATAGARKRETPLKRPPVRATERRASVRGHVRQRQLKRMRRLGSSLRDWRLCN